MERSLRLRGSQAVGLGVVASLALAAAPAPSSPGATSLLATSSDGPVADPTWEWELDVDYPCGEDTFVINDASLWSVTDQDDAFDDAYHVTVDGAGVATSLVEADLDSYISSGRFVGQGSVGSLLVEQDYLFLEHSPLVRVMASFTNPTSATLTQTVAVGGDLGSDSSTLVATTSSGDSEWTAADAWAITYEDYEPYDYPYLEPDPDLPVGPPLDELVRLNVDVIEPALPSDPVVVHWTHQPGAPLSPTVAGLERDECTGDPYDGDEDSFYVGFELSVAPGQTRRLAWLAALLPDPVAAAALRDHYLDPELISMAFSDLDPTTARQVANWSLAPAAAPAPVAAPPVPRTSTSTSQTFGPTGGTAYTGTRGLATPADPVAVAVTSRSAGQVSITEAAGASIPSSRGWRFLDHHIDIEAPAATDPDSPLEIEFRVHRTQLGGADANQLAVFRDGVSVPACGNGTLPCYRTALDGTQHDQVVVTVLTDHASRWQLGVEVPLCTGATSAFADARRGPHASAIACLEELGLVRGASAGSFAPGNGLTRGQAATMLTGLLREAGTELATAPTAFSDVANSPHAGAIAALQQAGIVTGTTGTQFDPGAPVSRAQLASLLSRTIAHVTGSAPEGPDAFSDDDGSVHERAINTVAALGLADGVAEGRFAPGATVRRGQMASFSLRLLELLVQP